ncbi:uncharacterized protein [Primulina eburnea]|uniref:uncharacterized protein n=1 Tax=Primulina eburnea TaxID=1245227 RepID=UPI003C6BE4BB
MSCLAWNVRGLGNHRAIRELRRLIVEKKPSLVFLSETKMTANKSKNWRDIWGCTGCFTVDSQGTKGGLMLLWNEGLEIHIKSFSMGHIDCSVRDGDKMWRFTGFYGHPETHYRNFSWDLLRRLSGIPELKGLPWLIGEDFNEICYTTEKLGGCPRPQLQMDAFRRVLDDCELRDLGCIGEFFTWANNRKSKALIF